MNYRRKKLYLFLITSFIITIIISIIPLSGWTGQLEIPQTSVLPGSGEGSRSVAIMVENSFAARPQSGLIFADVVFEVVDEYGITRFVAIYNSNDASVVGPVRSARPYYAEIARGFSPIYAFFGTYP